MELSFVKHVKDGYKIGDIGCGPNGAIWWDQISNCSINAFDLYFKPPSFERGGNKITFSKTDVSKPDNLSQYLNSFDVVVADHIFEHVSDPYGLAYGCNKILKKDGLLHVGIPVGDNFTDIFYRLAHSDGGGHIVKYTKDEFLELMTQHGFKLVEESVWADDWSWFDELYSKEETLNQYGMSSITTRDIKYMAEVFKKELTVDKGYFYGYEFLFKKIDDIDVVDVEQKDFSTKVRGNTASSHDKLMEISDWAITINQELEAIKRNFWYRVLRRLGLLK